MIIPCFRCGKEIDTPSMKAKRIPHPDGELDKEGKVKMVEESYYNADYIMAEDTKGKTAIICPDCYKDTDFVIWGVHKKEAHDG